MVPRADQAVGRRGCVSYMRAATTRPDAAVSPATTQIAADRPNRSAMTPARRALMAKPASRQSRSRRRPLLRLPGLLHRQEARPGTARRRRRDPGHRPSVAVDRRRRRHHVHLLTREHAQEPATSSVSPTGGTPTLIPIDPRRRPWHPRRSAKRATRLAQKRLRHVQAALDELAVTQLRRPLTPTELARYRVLVGQELQLVRHQGAA